MSYDTLRERVLSVRKDELRPQVNSDVLVGVVLHTVLSVHDIEDESNIMWFPENRRHDISKVINRYKREVACEEFDGRVDPDAVQIRYKGAILDGNESIDSLNHYDDQHVILTAHTFALPTTEVGLPATSQQQGTQSRGLSMTPMSLQDSMLHNEEATALSAAESHGDALQARDFLAAPAAKNRITSGDTAIPGTAFAAAVDNITDILHMIHATRGSKQGLEQLKEFFRHQTHLPRVREWLEQIQELELSVQAKSMLLGIVGNTGAGKSSMINALIGEVIAPTSGMRACTATVTQYAYNDDTNKARKYRAEIEYPTVAECEKEFSELLGDCFDEHGIFLKDNLSKPDTEAGLAWLKLSPLFPDLKKEDVPNISPQMLLEKPHVASLIAKGNEEITASTSKEFNPRIREYIFGHNNQPQAPKLWPLIKFVRIYLKADVLSTGLILVDLPGVQDSNTARGNVARQYRSKCDYLFVVSPIGRAVDDKGAHGLLSDPFSAQNRLDGMMSRITVVLTKSDEGSVEEISKDLDIEPELEEIYATQQELIEEKARVQGDLDVVTTRMKTLNQQLNHVESQQAVWSSLEENCQKYGTVVAPMETVPKKRKPTATAQARPKKRGKLATNSKSSAATHNEEAQNTRKILTMADVEAKVQELDASTERIEEELEELSEREEQLQEQLRFNRDRMKGLSGKDKILCIERRNCWSKETIQVEHEVRLREIEEERAARANNMVLPLDGNAIAALPVFSISSNAYLMKLGMMKEDGKSQYFTSLEATGVLQLREHCKNLTEPTRLLAGRGFLKDFDNLLVSIGHWSSNAETGVKLSTKERDTEFRRLVQDAQALGTALEALEYVACTAVEAAIKNYVKSTHTRAIETAAEHTTATVCAWGAPIDDGGLRAATYKACLRRNGAEFTRTKARGSATFHFNLDLIKPFRDTMLVSWEALIADLPAILKFYFESLSMTLNGYHDRIASRASMSRSGSSIPMLMDLKRQAWTRSRQSQEDVLAARIEEKQRLATMGMEGSVEDLLTSTYQFCVSMKDRGCMKLIKHHLQTYIQEHATEIFTGCADKIAYHLDMIRDLIFERLRSCKAQVMNEVPPAYTTAIVGADARDRKLTDEERGMHADTHKTVLELTDRLSAMVTDYSLEMDQDEIDHNEMTTALRHQSNVDVDRSRESSVDLGFQNTDADVEMTDVEGLDSDALDEMPLQARLAREETGGARLVKLKVNFDRRT